MSNSPKKSSDPTKELMAKAFQAGEAASMLSLLKAFVRTAQLTGYSPQQLAEVCTTISAMIYSGSEIPKKDYLEAVDAICESAGKLMAEVGLELNVNSKGGAA